MASRFWQAASSDSESGSDDDWSETGSESSTDSDSDSSSDSGSDSSSGSSEGAANKFLAGGDSDYDSDDSGAYGGKREVVSGRDKLLQALDAAKDAISDAIDEKEWEGVAKKVDSLFSDAEKFVQLTSTPTRAGRVPNVFIRALVEISDGVEEAFEDQEGFKKLNKPHAKALNILRQRFRKLDAALAELMAKCRADPGDFLEEEEDDAEGEGEEAVSKEKDSIFAMDPKDITYAVVLDKVNEAKLLRGKKGVSRQDQLNLLLFLRNHAHGPAQEVTVILSLISLMFDLLPASATHLT
jgi:translation initiation factor 3 subunit C